MSVGPTRGPVQRPGDDRDFTEIFQRLADVEAQPPGRWIYAGTYPGDPDTTPDSPPFQNGVTGWLRFRRTGEWNLDVEANVEIPGDAVYPLTVVTLDELYRPDVDIQAPGVGVDWELQTDGDLVATGQSGGGGCSCAAVDVTFDGSSTIPAENVQDAIEEVRQEIIDHIADPVGAHAASAISVDTPLLASDNVEDALEELAVCCEGSGGDGGSGVYEEVAYVEFTSSVLPNATTEATANTVVTATAFTADGAAVYLVELFTPSCRPDTGAAGRSLSHVLYLDGSSIGIIGSETSQAANSGAKPAFMARRLVPASGSRTFSWRAFVSAGTGAIAAGAGGSGNTMPGYIRVTRVA